MRSKQEIETKYEDLRLQRSALIEKVLPENATVQELIDFTKQQTLDLNSLRAQSDILDWVLLDAVSQK